MKFDRDAFASAVNDIIRLRYIRWQIFRGLSHLGWWICPEPHKSALSHLMMDNFEKNVAVSLEKYAMVSAAEKWTKRDHIRLHAGEMTTQEMRTAHAVANGIVAELKRIAVLYKEKRE